LGNLPSLPLPISAREAEIGKMLINLTVVAMAHPDTEIGKVIQGRGILVPPGDAGTFVNAIFGLAENP